MLFVWTAYSCLLVDCSDVLKKMEQMLTAKISISPFLPLSASFSLALSPSQIYVFLSSFIIPWTLSPLPFSPSLRLTHLFIPCLFSQLFPCLHYPSLPSCSATLPLIFLATPQPPTPSTIYFSPCFSISYLYIYKLSIMNWNPPFQFSESRELVMC